MLGPNIQHIVTDEKFNKTPKTLTRVQSIWAVFNSLRFLCVFMLYFMGCMLFSNFSCQPYVINIQIIQIRNTNTNHWALQYLEKVLAAIFEAKKHGTNWSLLTTKLYNYWRSGSPRKSEAENMAHFGLCWRHMVPSATGIYHGPTAMLCFSQSPSPPGF